MVKVRFHFVSANTSKSAPISTETEERKIKDALAEAAEFSNSPAARRDDLAHALATYRPHILHISGHGNSFGELMLFDGNDRPYGTSKKAIQEIFARYGETLRLVVLSACYSRTLAQMIFEYVPSVIGIENTVNDAEVATPYVESLYRLLRDGKDIHTAHDEVTQIVLRDNRIAEENWPRLESRATGPAAIPIPVPSRELSRIREDRKKQFDVDSSKYRVFADACKLTKRVSLDGCSVLEYKIENLVVTDVESSLECMDFRIETAAGLVHDPVLDENGRELGIYWKPHDPQDPSTFQEVIDQTRSIEGEFVFPQPLNATTDPFTFGWSVKVHNMDAITTWEFDNLYVKAEDRQHVDGSPLSPSREYIARLVWLPAKSLVLRLELPSVVRQPVKLRCFEPAKSLAIKRSDVLRKGRLLSMPASGLGSKAGSLRWEPRSKIEKLENLWVQQNGNGTSEATIEYPSFGSWYALEWQLKESKLDQKLRRFAAEAAAIRDRLVEHRQRRLANTTNKSSVVIFEFVKRLHENLRKRFPKEVEEETFLTSLLSYDRQARRLVMCEGFLNDGQPAPAHNWEFELPFGMGLGGNCFRSGGDVLAYAKDERECSEAETYLHFPNHPDYEYLIAMPIDHPDLVDHPVLITKDLELQRCRQLVAVLTIGSTYGPSKLQEFCIRPPQEEFAEWKKALLELRNECQRNCDWLSRFLLGRAQPDET